MRQEEKNRKSREHIISYAFEEFAEWGYMGASVNTICTAGKISKGLLYNYYSDKDALYLACVEKCFRELTEYLTLQLDAASVDPDQYFNTRLAFFKDNPLHQSLFCDAEVNPPPHLSKQLTACRSSFDKLNDELFAAILEKETLAEGVSLDDAIRQLRIFSNSISVYLKNAGGETWRAEEHNILCRQILHTLLYGLVARK